MNTIEKKDNLIIFKTKKKEIERSKNKEELSKSIKDIKLIINNIENYEKTGYYDEEEARRQKEIMNKKLLNAVKELHKYAISQGTGNDKRFYTYIYKPDGKRVPIRRKTEEEVLQALIKFYSLEEKSTLTTLYDEWIIRYAKSHRKAPLSTKRVECLWEKFYNNTDIIDKDITKITPIELYDWALDVINQNKLTSKKYSNMALIMRQLFNLATLQGIIPQNTFTCFKLERGIYYSEERKKANEEIFSHEEQLKIEECSWNDFLNKGSSIPLAINLAFQTGLRVGELVALKSTDRVDGKLIIQRQEIVHLDFCEETKSSINRKPIISDDVKCNHTREIFLTDRANKLIDEIIETNHKNGLHDQDFLFLNKDGRIHARALDSRIRKYCRQSNISERSMHKIRKTNITTLLDSRQFTDSEVQEHAGHRYLSTTLNHYVKNRNYDSKDTNRRMSDVLNII